MTHREKVAYNKGWVDACESVYDKTTVETLYKENKGGNVFRNARRIIKSVRDSIEAIK